MKRNHRQMWRSVIALVLTFTLVFGTASTAFAAGTTKSNDGGVTDSTAPDKQINYVSLGDSMTNGYGLTGYDGDIGVLDYGDESYANQFAEWLSDENTAVNHSQLAMSGMRAEDLHWLLELDYTDDAAIAVTDGEWDEELWNETFSTGDYWTYNEIGDNYRLSTAATYILAEQGNSEAKEAIADNPRTRYVKDREAAIVAEYYQNAVKEADIISLCMGNGNFGVFALGRIMEAIGFGGSPDETLIYKVENAIRECEPEMQEEINKLIDELYAEIEAFLGTPIEEDPMVEALANTAVYTGISYVLNYAGSVEAILQLNPDAEIILVGLMNGFIQSEEGSGDYSIGDLMNVIFTPLNAYIAALPTYMQATQNSVYKDATFYYAEEPNVDCLVNTFETTVYESPTIRERFVRDIVGTCACHHDGKWNCEEYGCYAEDEDGKKIENPCSFGDENCSHASGMVWGLLGGAELVPGIKIIPVTLEEIQTYQAKSDVERAAYAAENAQKAVSISVYLAFEDAIIAKGGKTPITISSVLGLSDLGMELFDPVMTDFMADVGPAGDEKAEKVYKAIATMSNGMLTEEDIANILVNGEEAIQDIAYRIVAGQTNNLLDAAAVKKLYNTTDSDRNAVITATAYTVVAAQSGGLLDANIVEALCTGTISAYDVAANIMGNGITAEDVKMAEEYGQLTEEQQDQLDGLKSVSVNVDVAKTTLETMFPTVTGGVDKAIATIKAFDIPSNVSMLCMLLAMPATLSDSLQGEATVAGLLNLFASCMLGDGVGVHPSADGHTAVFEAVKTSYETKYTAAQKTVDNLIYYVTEYYDEAYAYAYQYADENGYIDATLEGIDAVMAEMDKAVAAANASGMSDELKAELNAAYENAKATAKQLKNLIEKADVLDEETYNEAMALVAALEINLNDMCSVLEQVSSDAADQLWKAYEYLKPIVIEQLKIAVEKGTEWLMKKIQEAYDAFIKALPAIDKALYDWFYNNPETVIGFFYEYGDELGYLFDKYGDEVGKILAYVLYTYGPEAVEWALENPEEALAKWVEWYNKHGHKVWPMIDKYLETLDEMGAFDGLKAAAAELEAYVIAYAERVVAELQAKIDELNAAAKAALEELIKAIEDAKNGVDNGISRIMQALEDLYNQGVAIYKGATSGYYTVTDDSYYVALGDTDVEYAQIVADKMKLDKDQFTNAGIDGMRADDLRMILDADYEADAYGQAFGDVTDLRTELIEEIEKSDLITLGFNNNTITEFAANQIAAMIAGEEPAEMDWARYIGKDGAAVMADAMTEIKAALIAEGIETEVVDMVAAAIEYYAYACTGFTCNYPEVVELIKDINPETQVVVVGMYNPFENAVLDLEGTQIPVGDFVGMLVDLVNVYYTSHAILTGDAIYVNAPAVETQAPFDEALGIDEFIAAFADLDSLEPSAAGHEYIANQIMSAMNVVDKDVFNTLKYIERIKNFGEVTRDNLADAKALAEAARSAWEGLTDAEKENIGLDNYKVLVDFELAVAKVELGVAEDLAAAEKELADAEAKAAEIERALQITESTVTALKAKVINKSQIKVTWKAPETTPDQYRVTLMRAGVKVGTYWVAGDKETVTLKNLLRGTNFTVRVTAVAKVDDQKYFSIYKTSNKVKTQLQKANVTIKKSGKAKLIKSADQNSTGFQIYISKDKNFKKDVKKIKVYTGKKGLNKVIKAKNFKKGTNYVKVRAYTKVNGKTVYGAWSGAVKVTK